MKYTNPVVRGFHPDPSICKVGEDYYLVNSSFEYFPGIPVYHSRDLVNWKQIGNCITRKSQISLQGAKDSGGIWAPTIRHYDGKFYVTSTLDGCGNFIVSTDDIQGEWSDPVWVPMSGIDPSLYFENRRTYYCTNQTLHPGQEEITMAEIDIATGRLLSEIKTIWKGTKGGFLEAPHIYHIGHWYYMMTAEGGTNFNHMITIARNRKLWGDYESCPYNPILTNRHDTSKEIQCTGHGDLIEDNHGNWWMLHLGIRLSRRTMSHLGRETFLTPVEWKEDWPVIGNDGKAKLIEKGPLWEKQREKECFAPDFGEENWEPDWIFLRNPDFSNYIRGNGTLTIRPSAKLEESQSSPSFTAIRQCDFSCKVEANLQFSPVLDGDEAGILIYLSSEFYYRFSKKKIDEENYLVVEKKAEDFIQRSCMVKIKGERLRLIIEADALEYRFYYEQDEEEITHFVGRASTRFLSCEIAGKCFTGTVIGLYALCEEPSSAEAVFDNFYME